MSTEAMLNNGYFNCINNIQTPKLILFLFLFLNTYTASMATGAYIFRISAKEAKERKINLYLLIVI